jgi:hypothetical protein
MMEATQSLAQPELESTNRLEASISGEYIAYAALILLSLVLRIAQLDVVPLTVPEAREALAAWRVVYPDAPGNPIVSESPLLFLLHSLNFTTLGASEFTARIWTVLGGVALMLSPLLFRGLLGRARAFVVSLLLAFSPILLMSSRSDSPVIWTVLVGILALWGVYRYYETALPRHAILAIVLFVSAVLLTDPTGFVFVLILGGAAVFSLWLFPGDTSVESDTSVEPPASLLRHRLGTWPWLSGMLVALLALVTVSTLFMLYPQGLSAVGELLGSGVRGIVTPVPDTPRFFPLLVTVFYEPVLLVLGLAAVIQLVRRDKFTFVERFFTGWLICGIVASLVYAGAGAEQALWLVMPLAGLASSLVAGLLVKNEHPLWWNVPSWSRWIVALCGIFLLSMCAVHAQALGRALVSMPDGVLQFSGINSASLVLVLISIMSMVIGFFLASSLWGLETTGQGAVLALLFFALITSLGSGWRASVVSAENPIELWNRESTSVETSLLRATLTDLSRRESGGYPLISIAALVPEDGVTAWLLRDYANTRFITDVNDARNQEIAILPMYNEPPPLEGSYVGQTFLITRRWNPDSIQYADIPLWWLTGRFPNQLAPTNTVVLWLRQDIYSGVLSQSANG